MIEVSYYHVDPNALRHGSTFNVIYERLGATHSEGMMMVTLPFGRELLLFEGQAEYIQRIREATDPVVADIQKELG